MSSIKSVITTIRIRLDQAEEIEKRGENFNLSEFVREKLDEEFETPESLEEKEKEITEELKRIQKRKDEIINKEKKEINEEISPMEEKWLIETKKITSERPETIEPRRRAYQELFGKPISLKKFRELISK